MEYNGEQNLRCGSDVLRQSLILAEASNRERVDQRPRRNSADIMRYPLSIREADGQKAPEPKPERLMEVELGIAQLETRNPRQAAMLRLWLHNKVLPAFTARVLLIDTAIALRCARLHVPNTKSERDVWIAAT
ncbi:hypothetical protein [Sphingomonas sp. BAUL-RG-20F-R05-02]|uniref:hypothetical protein n=1 Tax=Sphingomonas sp. BAUL-RG-20F-R05-02 TaxID=2914830 RepID=UPI001F5923E4|nr:hypothetical protein [Sphingomonas sp. BAUL-RG-20F-R05-02]